MANYAEVMDMNARSMPKKGKSEHKLRSIEIERAANGGFIASHRFHNSGPGEYKEPEQHTFGADEGKKLIAHLGEHLGIETAKASEEPKEEEPGEAEEEEA